MDNSKVRKLYDAMSAKYNMTQPYEEFESLLNDEGKRRKVYDAMSAKYNMTQSFDEFNNSLMGNTVDEAVQSNQESINSITPAVGQEAVSPFQADSSYLTDEDRQTIADSSKMSFKEAKRLGQAAMGIAGQRPTADSSQAAADFINTNREAAMQQEETQKLNQQRKTEAAQPIAEGFHELSEVYKDQAKTFREESKQLEKDYYALTQAARDYATSKFGPQPKKLDSKEGWGKAYMEYLENNDPNKVYERYNNQGERSSRNNTISFLEHMANQTERRARQTLRQAERGVVGNTIAGVGYGLSQPQSWSLGMSDLWTAENMISLANKLKDGKQLTDYERAALDAYGTYQEAASILHEYDTRGFKAGVTTGEMAPFMVQMAWNPAGKLGTTLAQKGVRKAVMNAAKGSSREAAEAVAEQAMKDYGTMATRDLLRNYGVDGAMARIPIAVRKMGGDLAASAVLANTLQVGSTLNNIAERKYGAPVLDGEHYTFDPEQEKLWAEAAYKGELSSIIENFTEMMGEWRVLGLADKMSNFGTKGVGRLVRAMGDTDFAKGLGKVLQDAHWSGTIGEMLEEEYGIILNSLLTGDSKISDLWNLDQQIDIFLGVGLFGGVMGGAKMAAYPLAYVNSKKKLDEVTNYNQDNIADWAKIQDAIDNADNNGLAGIIGSTLRDREEGKDNGRAEAILNYIDALQHFRGVTIARDMLPADADMKTMQAFYLQGYDGTDKQAISAAYQHRKSQMELMNPGITAILDSEGIDVTIKDENGNIVPLFEGQYRQMALDYLNAKAAYDGMLDGITDRAQSKARAAEAIVRSNDNNGRQIEATTRTGDKVHIISGDVIMADGVANLDQSSKSIVIRHEDGTKEMVSPLFIKSIDLTTDTESAAAMAAQSAAQESVMTESQEAEISNADEGMQAMADNELGQQRGKEQADYQIDDIITLPDGTTGRVNLGIGQTEDGTVEVVWNTPDGNKVGRYTADQLYDMQHPEGTTAAAAQTEQVEATQENTEPTPQQQAYDEWVAKHGDNALNKLNQTRAYAEKELAARQKELNKVQSELNDLPDVEDEAITKKKAELEKKQTELQSAIGNYSATLDRMNAIQSVYDAQNQESAAEQKDVAIRNRAAEWEKNTGVKVIILERPEDVPNEIARQKIQAGENVKGWFEKGQVYVYLPNNTGTQDFDQTFIHEVIAHKGLEEMLGTQLYAKLCRQVWDQLMTEEQKQEYLALVGHVEGKQAQQLAAADEFIAYFAEKMTLNPTAEVMTTWQQFVKMLTELLNKVFGNKVTEQDLSELLIDSLTRYQMQVKSQEAKVKPKKAPKKKVKKVNKPTDFQNMCKAIEDVIDEMDFETQMRYAASKLGHSIVWGNDPNTGTKGLGSHIVATKGGASEQDRRKYFAWEKSRRNGGKYPEEIAESIMANMPESLTEGYDTRDALRIILDAITGSSSPSDVVHQVYDDLIARQEAAEREEEERQQYTYAKERGFGSYEELVIFDANEDLMPLSEEEWQQYYNSYYGEGTDGSSTQGVQGVVQQPAGQGENLSGGNEVGSEQRSAEQVPSNGRTEAQEGSNPVLPETEGETGVIQGLEGYSLQNIQDIILNHIADVFQGEFPEGFQINGIGIIGSRANGTAREDSDLDVLLEYEGDISEDALYNMLNGENGLEIEGIKVDINPITPGKSGTIQEFLERNNDYKKEGQIDKSIANAANPLSAENADVFLQNMKGGATPIEIEAFTEDKWKQAFPNNTVDSPIGKIKIGENQKTKLIGKKRANQFGLIKPTLESPDVILYEEDSFPPEGTERTGKLLFVKTFKINGKEITHFESVTVRLEGLEINVSNHIVNENALKGKLQQNKIVYIKKKLLPNSSESRLAERQNNMPDLVPTQGNSSSESKDTQSSESPNENRENIELTDVQVEALAFVTGKSEEEIRAQQGSLPYDAKGEKTLYHPATLRASYESGNAADIAKAEKAVGGYIMSSNSIERLDYTAKEFAVRKKQTEKGSAEYWMDDFCEKKCRERIKQLNSQVKYNQEIPFDLSNIPDTIKIKQINLQYYQIFEDGRINVDIALWVENGKPYIRLAGNGHKKFADANGYRYENATAHTRPSVFIPVTENNFGKAYRLAQSANNGTWEKAAKLDAEYVKAVKSGDIDKALDMLRKKALTTEGITGYVAPNAYSGSHRDVAKLIKTGKSDAVQKAAADMARFVPGNAVLVPIPSHEGKVTDETDTKILADAVAEITGSPVIVALEGNPRESRYQAKQQGKEGLKADELGFRQIAEIPEGKIPVFVDNVVDSGETAKAASEAIRGGFTMAYAKGVRSNPTRGLKNMTVTYDDNGNLIPLSERFNSESDDIRFREANDRASLMGAHNISEEKLKKVLKQGGLANPSMAIVDTDKFIHQGYGDISLIPYSSTLDASKTRGVVTYNGDAWSPTYPGTKRILTKKGEDKLRKLARKLADKNQELYNNIITDFWAYVDDNYTRLAVPYLLSQGEKVEIQKEKPKYSREFAKEVAEALGVDAINDDVVNLRELTPEQNKALFDLLIKRHNDDVENQAREMKDKEKADRFRKFLNDTYRGEIADKDGKLHFSKWNSLLYSLWRSEEQHENPRTDWNATRDMALRQIEDKDDYWRWIGDLLTDEEWPEKLYAGTDNEGRPRYIPATLENASRLMNREKDLNSYDQNGYSATKAMLLKKMRTLSDIHRMKEQLATKEEVSESYDKLSEEWFDVIGQLSKMQKISDNQYSNVDYAEYRLQEAILKSNPVKYLNEEYGYDIDENSEYAKQLKDIIEKMKNAPVKYFETKFSRPVYLYEFKHAIVPNDIDAEVRSGLEKAGIRVTDYESGNTDDFVSKVREATNGDTDVRFRVANENQAIFVSNAERAVESIKQDKAMPDQWLAMIQKQGGIKTGEDKWLNLSQWIKTMKEMGAKTLTKQEILDYIDANKIEITEERYANDLEGLTELQAEFDGIYDRIINGIENGEAEDYDAMAQEAETWNEFSDYASRAVMNPRQLAWEELRDNHNGGDDFDMAFSYNDQGLIEIDDEDRAGYFLGVKPINSTRLGYTTEGLDNKREITLTVPTIEPWNESDNIHFGDAGSGRAIAWIRFGDTSKPTREEVSPTVDVFKFVRKHDRNGYEIYHPYGSYHGLSNNFYVYHRPIDKNGNMGYVLYDLSGKTLNVSENLEEVRNFLNDYLKEKPLSLISRKRILVIDEIQSKRHQEGREKGYMREPLETLKENGLGIRETKGEKGEERYEIYWLEDGRAKASMFKGMNGINDINAAAKYLFLTSFFGPSKNSIPDAPFDKNWQELAMKRMLRLAAEEGYDKLAWTTGEQQSERYGLAEYVDEIKVADDYDGDHTVIGRKDGGIVIQKDAHGGEAGLAELLGKDLARKAYSNLHEGKTDYLNDEGVAVFTGDNLRIGGQGMEGFYDRILVSFMNKYGKQWGVQVEDVHLPGLSEQGRWENAGDQPGGGLIMHSIDVTPEMKRDVMEGQVMFRVTPEQDAEYRKAYEDGDTEKAAQMVKDAFKTAYPDSKIVDEKGEPLIVKHATNHDFTVFDISQLGKNSNDKGLYGAGFYFGTYVPGWLRSSKNTMSAFLNVTNPFELKNSVRNEGNTIYDYLVENFDIPSLRSLKLTQYGKSIKLGEYIDIIKSVDKEIDKGEHDERLANDEEIQVSYRPEDRLRVYREGLISKRAGDFGALANTMGYIIGEVIGSEEFTNDLRKGGYDGVIARGDSDYKEYVAFEPSQIKSAEPFTFDDNGELIALSERFNPENDDIRFRESGKQLSLFTPEEMNGGIAGSQKNINFASNKKSNERGESDIQRKGSPGRADSTGRREDGISQTATSEPAQQSAESVIKPLRKLKEGETCHVERKLSEAGDFSFIGKDKIETIEDVAFIFRKLETKAVENAFIAFVKNGKATILHVGMGPIAASLVDLTPVTVMMKNINPDKVYFIHNHPSGQLTSSNSDRQLWRAMKSIMGDKLAPGIIIDTTKGKYGMFEGDAGFNDIEEFTENSKGEQQIPVYRFDERVFSKDYDPESSQIRTSRDIAAFVAGHRLGERDKISVLCLDHSSRILGNFFLPYTDFSSNDTIKKIAVDSAYYAGMCGATAIVLYGNGVEPSSTNLPSLAARTLKEFFAHNQLALLDIVGCYRDDTGYYYSYADHGYVAEPGMEYGKQEALKQAEAETDTNPTQGQKEAGNYKKGHVRLFGMDLSIEQPRGSVRSGTDADGKQWSQEMHNTYGYIRGTMGRDKDHIDVFLGDNLNSDKVFVVDQRNIKDGSFDEHKVMLGFDDIDAARKAYESNYEKGWRGMAAITETTLDDFKEWAFADGRRVQPFSQLVKTNQAGSTRKTDAVYAEYDRTRAHGIIAQSVNDEATLEDIGKLLDENKEGSPEHDVYNTIYTLAASGLSVREAKDTVINESANATESIAERRMEQDLAPVMEPLTQLAGVSFRISREPSRVRSEYNNGDIVVYNPKSAADVQAAVMRESYTHKDIRNVPGWDALTDAAYRLSEGEIASKAVRGNMDFEAATEEWMYENAERMVAPFEVMMSRNRVNLLYRMTGDEIRMYLTKSDGLLGDAELFVTKEELPVEESVRFRRGSSTPPSSAQQLYDASQQSLANKFYRAYVDYTKPLRDVQEIIAKESGTPIQDFENAWEAENQRSSKSKNEIEQFELKYFEDIREAVKALEQKTGMTYNEVLNYLIAKHGLERNVVLAQRDAEADYRDYLKEQPGGPMTVNDFFLKRRKRDYSGLTDLSGKQDVADAEDYARTLVQTVESMASKETDALWQTIKDAVEVIQKKRYQSGMISREQMQKEADMFDNYIPLRGFAETIAEDVYDYYEDKMRNRPQYSRRAGGRSSLADDPLATLGAMAASAIMQGNNNLMKQRFLNMVENHKTDIATIKDVWVVNHGTPSAPVWEPEYPDIHEGMDADDIRVEIEKYTNRMQQMQRVGLARKATNRLNIKWRTLGQQAKQHIITVRRNGEEQMIIINGNPQVARTVNGINNPDADLSNFMRGVREVQRFMAANFTTRNPAFVVANLCRDLGFAVMAVSAKENAAYRHQFMKNITGPVIKTTKIGKLLRKWQAGTLDVNNELERYFGEFMDNGGETGYTAENTVDAFRKKMMKGLKDKSKATKAAEATLEFFELCNRSVEDFTRFMTYMTSRQMGRTVQRSVADAKNITVNFNRKGSGEMLQKYIASGYLFFNAGVQSLQNVAKISGIELSMDEAKGKARIKIDGKKLSKSAALLFGSQVMMGMVFPMLNEFMMGLWGGDDDDEAMVDEDGGVISTNPYRRLTEYERRNNLCLWIGGNRFIKIPLAIELRAFYGLGETIYGYMTGIPNPNPGADILTQIADLLPVNFVENNGLVPDVAAPLWQSFITNENFMGIPLYNDSEYLKNEPEANKVYSNTGDAYIALSRWINELGGGDEVSKSKLDGKWNNPAVMQNIVEGYLGGLLTTSRQTANLIGQPVKKFILGKDVEPIPARDWPVVNRLYINTNKRNDDRYVKERYYNYRDQAEKVRHDIRKYEERLDDPKYMEKYQQLLESPVYLDYITFDALNKAVKDAHQDVKEYGDEFKIFETDAMRELVNAMDEDAEAVIQPEQWGRTLSGKDKNISE